MGERRPTTTRPGRTTHTPPNVGGGRVVTVGGVTRQRRAQDDTNRVARVGGTAAAGVDSQPSPIETNRAARVGQRRRRLFNGALSFHSYKVAPAARHYLTAVNRQIGECRATLPALSFNSVFHYNARFGKGCRLLVTQFFANP